MTTFAGLGVPFPLFEALTKEAAEYAGVYSCRLCDGRDQHCFELGIGCAVIQPCPACGAENGLDAHDRNDVPCRSCGATVLFPESLRHKKNLYICHRCLRSGRGAITKDTEFGMVSWEQAFQGVTNGVPARPATEFELVPLPDEGWYAVRIPQEHLFELLRTPTYIGWQDEQWLFCCRRPMTYLGAWADVRTPPRPLDDARTFFEQILDRAAELKDWLWDALDRGSGDVCLYLFQCKVCGRCRAHWDMD